MAHCVSDRNCVATFYEGRCGICISIMSYRSIFSLDPTQTLN